MFVGMKVEFPIYVNVENIGAIHIAEGCDGKRTKHIDIKYHFIRSHIEDGVIKIVFVSTKENKDDPFTKNVNAEDMKRYRDEYLTCIQGH